MWILIDNYDSFTHILLHYLQQLQQNVRVYKNDEIAAGDIDTLQPDAIIISPGPGRPENAGLTMEIIASFIGRIPILGICLGHQALGEYLGADLVHADYPMHGKQSRIDLVTGTAVDLSGITSPAIVMRYHSLVLERYRDINGLIPLAYAADDRALMMFYHAGYQCMGIQFHPESVGTEQGMLYLRAWYNWVFSDAQRKEFFNQ